MNQEEIIIRQITDGKKPPFRVPEGYFEQFTGRLLTRLPRQRRHPSLLRRVWRYAAVMAVVAGAGVAFYAVRQGRTANESVLQETYQEEYINDALDYAMVNNNEIALYLTEAD